ncbi:hypothetical protein QA639_37110 [Bradyrhizobium pachyrhizi]|uniref:hypothetical protein n=1 Tax=Bradyrhizobium pachyrhizi TaxID=280333 RepID=UPI0018DF1D80|nr:hypothetical protein [Bradyrhizobium pachyrhizi]WFU55116.1 hypothetical protein QA639_37110 [Bradyrhizobium pachyrhizi]
MSFVADCGKLDRAAERGGCDIAPPQQGQPSNHQGQKPTHVVSCSEQVLILT